MTYLLQVSTCWIVFFAIYLLFLQKETFFIVNRYYLLSALLLGLGIPLFGVYLPANQTSTEIYQVMSQMAIVDAGPSIDSKDNYITWLNFIYLIYTIGAVVVLSRFIYGLAKIYDIYNGSTKRKLKNFTLVESEKTHLPFSFFHYIFISKKLLLKQDIEKVIKHEELHANQWHSLDIVILELLNVFFWFNPVLLFYKRALKQSHEFLADEYVLKEHKKSSYGQLLLRQSKSGLEIALANHFFHSQIKKRITMMYKEKSKRPAMVKYLIAIPVLLSLLVLFASSKSNDLNSIPHKDCVEIQILNNNTYIYQGQAMELKSVLSKIKDKTKVACVNLNIVPSVDRNAVTTFLNELNRHDVPIYLNESNQAKELKSASSNRKILGEENEMYETEQKSKTENKDFIGAANNLFPIKKELEKSNTQDNSEIYKVVEEMPRFPGCEDENLSLIEKDKCSKKLMLNHIYQHLKYPKSARDKNIEGMVVIQFIIEKDGKISNGKIVRNIGGKCGEAALSTVNSMPIWIPGKQNGDNVRVQYTLPVKFKLDGPEKDEGVDVEKQKSKKLAGNDVVYKVVEQMPRFPGCEDFNMSETEKESCAKQKMMAFIFKNIKYPSEAKKKGIEGVAVVELTIDKDGSVVSSEVLSDPGGGTGNEAKRVIDAMPKWIPGKQNGNAVKVQYVLPIRYKLQEDDIPSETNKTVDTRSLLLDDFRVTPNPSNGTFNLSFDCTDKSSAEIIFYALNGQVLKKIYNASIPFNQKVDLSEYTSQTLIINVVQKDKIYSEKIILQK